MKKFILLFFLVNSALCAQENGLLGGSEFSAVASGSSNYGWELAGGYPFLGLQLGHFRLCAFAGGGFSISSTTEEWTTDSGVSQSKTTTSTHFRYALGGNFDFLFDDTFVSIGGGITGGNIMNENKDFSPFVRTAWGFFIGETSDIIFQMKFYYDFILDGNNTKMGISFGLFHHWN